MSKDENRFPGEKAMIRFNCIFLMAILCILTTTVTGAQEHVYTVGVVPQFEARKLHAIWRPILDRIEQEAGIRLTLRGSPTIPEFEREFSNGRFDFAYMNPYHLIMANKTAGYIPLVRDHGRRLYGVLVVRKDSRIDTPAALNGKSVAFPAPNALGASLQMRQELLDLFGVTVKPLYVKTHDAVYLNVLLNETAAGGGVQKTLDSQKAEFREALKIIHTTQKVAPHPFSALPSVPDEIKKAVQEAFIKMGQSNADAALLETIPITQVGTATLDDYLPLKNMGLERFFVAPN